MTVKELRIRLEIMEELGFENHQIYHDVCYQCDVPIEKLITEENPSKVIISAGCK